MIKLCDNCKFFKKSEDNDGECGNDYTHELIHYWDDISFDKNFGCINWEGMKDFDER